jgi:hypothetical protein
MYLKYRYKKTFTFYRKRRYAIFAHYFILKFDPNLYSLQWGGQFEGEQRAEARGPPRCRRRRPANLGPAPGSGGRADGLRTPKSFVLLPGGDCAKIQGGKTTST